MTPLQGLKGKNLMDEFLILHFLNYMTHQYKKKRDRWPISIILILLHSRAEQQELLEWINELSFF